MLPVGRFRAWNGVEKLKFTQVKNVTFQKEAWHLKG